MILRNSKNSIFRTPAKSLLLLLVITAVTAFLYLGVNIWVSSGKMLEKCGSDYSTIAVFEYRNGDDEDSVYDSAMQSDLEKIDFSQIISNENLLEWQPTVISAGIVPGYRNVNNKSNSKANFSVIVVRYANQMFPTDAEEGESCYMATVTNVLSGDPELESKMIRVFTGEVSGFAPEYDEYYVLYGAFFDGMSAYSSFRLNYYETDLEQFRNFVPYKCIMKPDLTETISSEDVLKTVPEQFMLLAKYSTFAGNVMAVREADDLLSLEEFHQKEYYFSDGGAFDSSMLEGTRKYCVVPENIAASLKLSAGDEIELQRIYPEGSTIYDCYSPDKELISEKYIIAGLIKCSETSINTIYIPYQTDRNGEPYCSGHVIGTALIKNGSADAFLESLSGRLPERVTVSTYDRGYMNIMRSVTSILNVSKVITFVSVAAAIAILMLFAYLFIAKQKETVLTMGYLGTRKSLIVSYLMFGCSIISVTAAVIGVVIGWFTAYGIIKVAYSFSYAQSEAASRFSTSSLGIAEEFTPISEGSPLLMLIIGGAVILMSLACCLLFALKTLRPARQKKQKKTRSLKPPKDSSEMRGGAVKYAMLSIRRGGARTLIVPAVSLVMVIFLCTLAITREKYEGMLGSLYENADITGSFSSVNGKYTNDITVDFTTIKAVAESGYVKDLNFALREHYMYPEGGWENFEFPRTSFSLETLKDKMSSGGNIYFTASMLNAPEFLGLSEPKMTFADGYDYDTVFSDHTWNSAIPCMATTDFLEHNKLSLGDTVDVLFTVDLTTVKIKIVGSFEKKGIKDNLYCPLPAVYADIANTDLEAERDKKIDAIRGQIDSYGYYNGWLTNSSYGKFEEYFLFLRYSANSCSFKLKDAGDLDAFKDCLDGIGLSRIGRLRMIRMSVLLSDRETVNNAINIKQNIQYMNILLPAIYLLTAVLGYTVSYLMINSRREEIATMRGAGTRKKRTFMSFFTEQLLLCLTGSAVGLAIMLAADFSYLMLISGGLYALFYIIGAIVSTSALTGSNLLTILSERE